MGAISFEDLDQQLRGSPAPRSLSLGDVEGLLRRHDSVEPPAPPAQAPEVSDDSDIEDFIAKHEGFRERAYPDLRVGTPVIGHGTLLDEKRKPGIRKLITDLGYDFDALASGRAAITEDDAKRIMRAELPEFRRMVESRFGAELPRNKLIALMDLGYQSGGAFFRPRLQNAIATGDDDNAIEFLRNAYVRDMTEAGIPARAQRRADMFAGLIPSARAATLPRNGAQLPMPTYRPSFDPVTIPGPDAGPQGSQVAPASDEAPGPLPSLMDAEGFTTATPEPRAPDALSGLQAQDETARQDSSLFDKAKDAFTRALDDVYQRAIAKPAQDIATGYRGGAAGMYHTAGNFLELLNRANDYLARETGIGALSEDTMFGFAERWLREAAQKVAPNPDDVSQDLVGKIYQGLGAAPAAIAEYLPAIKALGAVGGMAAVDALRASDKGAGKAAEGAVKGALMGGALKGVEHLTVPGRVATMGAVGAAGAAAETADPKDIAAGAVVMGALGAAGQPGPVRLRDLPSNILPKPEAPKSRVDPTIAPLPEAEVPARPEPVPARESEAAPVAEPAPARSEPIVARDRAAAPEVADTATPERPSFLDARLAEGALRQSLERGRELDQQVRLAEAEVDRLVVERKKVGDPGDGRMGIETALSEIGVAPKAIDQLREINVMLASGEGRSGRKLSPRQIDSLTAERQKLLDQGIGPDALRRASGRILEQRAEIDQRIAAAQERVQRLNNQRQGLEPEIERRADTSRRAEFLTLDQMEARVRESDTATRPARDEVQSSIRVVPERENIARGRVAVEDVLSQRGSARNAMWRDDFGDISFDYGVPGTRARQYLDGWGLSHIIARRNLEGQNGEAFVRNVLPEVLARGRLERIYGPHNGRRADIDYRDYRAVLSLYRFGKRESWVLTGFEKRQAPSSGSGGPGGLNPTRPYAPDRPGISDTAGAKPEGSGEAQAVNATHPYAGRPSGIQAGLGAEPTEKVIRPAAPGKGERLSIKDVEDRLRQGDLPDKAENRQAMTPGANYVGSVPDVFDPAVPATGKPIRREDILGDLMKALGVPLYQGRIKNPKMLGFYRKRLEEIRVKNAADIETTAHEAAHLLDDRIPEIRQQWRHANKANAEVRAELSGISYDKTKLYEGFAEFVRLWMTQKHQAEAKAPKFNAWFEDFVARSEYGPALRKTQERMHDWFAQAALDRARSKIGAAQDINAGLTRPLDRFRQSVFDDLHGIMNMEREIKGGILPVGAYETARLVRGKSALIEGALTLGAPKVRPDGSHTFEGKSLEKILDPVTDKLDDFLLYAVGRSARELAMQGREHLFTRPEINAMVSLETPQFRQAFDDYQVWNRAILDFAEAKGVINPEFRATWSRTQYLPFHRVGQGSGSAPVPGDFRGIKALTGGTANIRDVLGNMIQNAAMLIDAALTNEARVKVAQLAKSAGGAKFMAEIPKDDRVVKVHFAEVERTILDALGVKGFRELPVEQQAVVGQIVENLKPFAEFVLRGQTPLGPNVVAVLRSGKPEYYEVADPLLYRSLVSLNRPAQSMAVKVLSWPRRIGQASITLAPDFLIANFGRDTLMGAVMSRHGFRPIIDSAKGFVSRLRQDEAYRDFVANGGGLSSYLLDEANFRTHLERFYTKRGINYQTVMDSPQKLLFGLERIADAIEASTRIGEFKRAVGRGEHPRHAAYSAREVSTDFAMRGDNQALGFMYDTVIFLKAAMNGLDRFYRGLAYDPNATGIAAKTGLLALLSMGLYGINRDNPLYDQLENWDRDGNWHFFVPKPDAAEDAAPKDRYIHLRFPKIWEVGAIASIAERSLEGILNNEPVEAGKRILKVIGNTLNFEYMPQAFAPVYELAINRHRFTDRPIEDQAERAMEPWARTGSSAALRKLGEAQRGLPRELQVSPAQIEHLLKGYFNTFAMYGLSLADAALVDSTPDLRTDQYPILRRFYRQEPAPGTRYVTELYDAIKESTEARRTMRFMDRQYRPDIAKELETKRENLEYDQLHRAEQHMQVIRKDRQAVLNAPDVSDLQKLANERAKALRNPALIDAAKSEGAWSDAGALRRFLLDDLMRERNEHAKGVMTDIKTRRKLETTQ